MVFAEFQKWSTGWNGVDYSGPREIIPALGSDGVIVLQGSLDKASQMTAARKRIDELRGVNGDSIIGFKLFSGRNFLDCRPLDGGRLYSHERKT